MYYLFKNNKNLKAGGPHLGKTEHTCTLKVFCQ